MTVSNFIKNLINDSSEYILTQEDKKTIQFEGIEKYIYKKLNNTNYRASKTDDSYDNTVRQKISYCVKNNLPIHIDLSTGATKNPRVITAPGIDWAEVFNIALIRDFLKPIAAGYDKGVTLDYFSVALFEEKVNYIPQQDSELWESQFSHLIDLYNQFLPKNFSLRFSRLTDQVDRTKVLENLQEDIEKRKLTWESLSIEERTEKLRKAERNIKWTGDETNREEMILLSALAHDAFVGESWITLVPDPIWYLEDDISLGHRNTKGWAIHVRSAQASTVNFWSGMGVLQKKGNTFITNVLSPTQYDKVKNDITNEVIEYFSDDAVLCKKLSTIPVVNN